MIEAVSTKSEVRVKTPLLALPPFWRATVSGLLATFAMTAFVYLTQVFGITQLEIARSLGGLINEDAALLIGTALHVIMGVVLGLVYAFGFRDILPGPGWARGLIYSMLPNMFLMVAVPLAAWGLLVAGIIAFGPLAAVMWILDQLVYGIILGALYGTD